jgi:NTP pyrophosphatase (non-canonical NTP hydrolase)
MTTEQAIEYWIEFQQEAIDMIVAGDDRENVLAKQIPMCDMALAALRTQQPLTLAIRSVQAERKRQDEKWGDQSGNHPFEWVSILGEEYGELCEAVNETFFKNGDKPERGGIDKMRKEAVQVAAVAVALIEALDKSDHGNIHDNPELVKEGNE